MLSLAQTGLFRARWSEHVHTEWMNAVVKRRQDLTLDDLNPTRRAMDRSVLDCLVTGYESFIETFDLPDPEDRHILAAAMVARANVIVTFNQQDFPEKVLSPLGIHTRHPDDFILDVEGIDSGAFVSAMRWDLNHYRKPPISFEDYVQQLRDAGAPNTAERLIRLRILLT